MNQYYRYIFLLFILFVFTVKYTANAEDKPVWAYKNFSQFNSTRIIENKGQLADKDGNISNNVKFYLQSGNLTAYFTKNSIIYTFHKQLKDKKDTNINLSSAKSQKFWEDKPAPLLQYYVTEMMIVGSNDQVELSSGTPNSERLNFYYPHCPNGIIGVKTYQKIEYRNIYPKIDLLIYATGNKFGFKYDFIVHPGADISQIKLLYKNGNIINKNSQKITITYDNYKFFESIPYVYQEIHNKQKVLQSGYKIKNNIISFAIDKYDKTKDLIIDPVINWATYYGGSDGDHSESIALDNQANVIIAGNTLSKDLPVTNSGTYQKAFDIFVAKFDYTGKRIWATYYGSRDADYTGQVSVDPAAHIYVVGWTWGNNFPVSSGAFQTQKLGGYNDGVLIKFNRDGVRDWATYLGGYSEEHLYAVAIDNKFNVYTAGWSRSSNFPNNKAPINPKKAFDDIAITALTLNGDYQWSTFIGGDSIETANDIAIDKSGNILITGTSHSNNFKLTADAQQKQSGGFLDAVIVKFSPEGNLLYSSYLGGNLNDYGMALGIDSKNNYFITGFTRSKNFPVNDSAYQKKLNGFSNCFITKFSPKNSLSWSTYLGGSKEDYSNALTIDRNDNVIIAGQTTSSDFPATPNAVQSYIKGPSDAFGAKFTNDGQSAAWITFYGGDDEDLASDIAVDYYQNLYFTGDTKSTDFPVTQDAFQKNLSGQYDCFIFKHCATSPYTEIAINGKTTFCDGGFVELDAGAGFLFYEWSSGETTQKIKVTKSGFYTVHVTDTMYCDFTSDPVAINVLALPEPVIEGNPKFCEGDSAVLTVPDGYISWEWSNGSKEKTIVLHNDQTIILSVTDTNNCTGYDTAYVKKLPRPKPYIQGPKAVCLDIDNIKYSVYGIAGHIYKWDIIGGTINTGVDYFSILVHWTIPGQGRLIISETNQSGCTGYDTLYVNVTDHLEPQITSDKNRFVICEGDSLTLDAGYGYLKYNWNTGSTERFIGVTKAGEYYVEVVAEGDCQGFDTVQVDVHPVPAPVITGDTTFCAESYGITYTAPFNEYYQYYWTVENGEIVQDDSTNTIAVDFINPGKAKITLTAYDTLAQCSGTTELEIIVKPKPKVKIKPLGDIVFCDGDSVILDAGNHYKSYFWNTGDTTYSITVKQSGVYSVVAYNQFDCSNTDSIKITVLPRPPKPVVTSVEDTIYSSPGDMYIWYRNDTLLTDKTTQWFVSHTDGDYKVVHRNENGCESVSDVYKYKYKPIVGLAVLYMPDTIYVRTGDPVVIPISIEKSYLLDKINANNFIADISFDGSVLVPDNPDIPFVRNRGRKTITVHGSRTDSIGTIYTLYLHAALGDSVCTNLTIDSVSWDSYRDVLVRANICTVCLTNICHADGTRLYLNRQPFRLEQNRPNPAQDHTSIEFNATEQGNYKLTVVNIFGQTKLSVFSGYLKAGVHIFELNTSILSSGIYYYILQTPSAVYQEKMQVIK